MIIGNQRGAALIMSVLASVIVILIFNQTLSSKLGSVNREVQKQTRISGGIQVMHDFAIIAQRANETFLVTAGACTADTAADASRPFCWPTAATPADLRCVNHPLSDPADPVVLCLTGAGPRLAVASNGKLLNEDVRWWEAFLPNSLNPEAHAQEVIEAHRPTLAGAPTNNITPEITCDAATAGDTYCKRCSPAGSKNMDCILLKVCLLALPAGTPCAENQYLRQVVGLMPH